MSHAQRIGFDGWILHLDLGELTRNGETIRLQDQPLQVLHELLSHPGELVTREQLIARLWPKGVVDFDLGLNSAVRKLRHALKDDADTPRYIQTVPRKGYRFIGTLDPIEAHAAPTLPLEGAQAIRPSVEATASSRPSRAGAVVYLSLAAMAIVAIVATFWTREASVPRASPMPARPALVAATPPTLTVIPADNTPRNAALAAVLRDGLADVRGLAVLSSTSADILARHGVEEIRRRQGALTRYVLRSRANGSNVPSALQVDLLDTQTGTTTWSQSFDMQSADLAAIRDAIVRRTAESLRVDWEPNTRAATVDPDAYELYVRARRLIASARPEDTDEAAMLLMRVTELDPQFSRAYVALAEALVRGSDLRSKQLAPDVAARAHRALDRALELNPDLGEAWICRARLLTEPAEIDEHYQRGIFLAPGFDLGYANYSKFLADQRRRGEAIEIVERARRIDPFSMPLFQMDAVMRILSRSDVPAHDAVLREALALDPENAVTLIQMAQAKYLWRAELAESIRLYEQALAVAPRDVIRQLGASVYLDLDEPDAVAKQFAADSPVSALIELAQYRGDPRKAAALAARTPIAPFHAVSPVAEAVRDGAILTGDYAPAVARLEAAYREWPAAPITIRSVAAVYAHTLILAGATQRGKELAKSLLAQVEAEGEARPNHWFARDRATLYAILGEDERALDELSLSVEGNHIDRWWYTAKHDPLFERFRRHPRFVVLNAKVERLRAEQRAELERMRRAGLAPRERSAAPATGTVS